MPAGSGVEMSESSASVVDRALLALAVVAGAAIRLIPPWSSVFAGPGVWPLGPDSYCHLRRIHHAVKHFPAILDFDPYVNFPGGAPIFWPPGFDRMLAGAARWMPRPEAASVERFCAVAIPLLGLAAILAVYAFGRAGLSRPGAGAAAFVFALLPAPVNYSLLGYVDHHVIEPFFLALPAALFLAGLARRGVVAAAVGATAGALVASSCWFVTDGIALVILLCTLGVFEGLVARFPGSRPAGLSALAASAAVIVPLSWTTPWGRTGTMTYLTLSPFQAHLAVAGAGLGAALILGAWRGARGPLRIAGVAAGITAGAAALLHGGREMIDPVREALRFLTRAEGLESSLAESVPLWSLPWSTVLLSLTPLGILAPGVLILSIHRDRRERAGSAALLGLAAFLAGLVQMRFMPLGGVAVAWASGRLVTEIWRGTAGGSRRVLVRGAAIGAVAACLVPFPLLRPFRADGFGPTASERGLAAVLHARRDPRMNLDASGRPPWGVAAPWSVGCLLIDRAGVPVVASPFGQAPWHIEGVRRVIRIDLAEGDTAAADLCARLHVRYVVTTDPFAFLGGQARTVGVPLDRYLVPGPGGENAASASPLFLRTAVFRLHLLDGSAARTPALDVPAMPSFRLVWESDALLETAMPMMLLAPGARPSEYKLFEVVKGARVEGRCEPGGTVEIRVGARTNVRALEWWDETRCGATGRYALRTPYPSREVRVSQGARRARRVITEEHVWEGEVLEADLLGP